MFSPKSFYKTQHPDYFSDTDLREVQEVDRSLLEYHLSTLTGRSQEMDFERFARRLCEKEICPNLLPTTGPTGGGDSKADSETFPVSDALSLNWFSAIARDAAKERWAFAFSAKAQWRPKVKSDVEKIVETKRGYSKAFFVTNQAVPAKKRAELEDELSKKHGIGVHILDRNWLLERVFNGRHEELAITELKVTALTRKDSKIGPLDTERIALIDELEKRIANALQNGQFGPALVDDALDVANIYRALERSKHEVEGSYSRADRLATQYGTLRQRVESAYQWGWTLYWWIEDMPALIVQYQTVEDRAKDSENVYDLERLSNLWTVANTYILKNNVSSLLEWIKERRQILYSALQRLAADQDRPSNSLQARSLCLVQLGTGSYGNPPRP